MIKVVFKNGLEQYFEANAWNYRDVKNKNVWLINDEKIIVHLNWDQVRYVEMLEEVGR